VDISEYVVAFCFNTFIPVDKWVARKSELEMYFGEKIVGIRQSAKDNRVIEVLVELFPLPDYVEWNDGFMNNNVVRSPDFLTIGVSYNGTVGMNLSVHPHAFIAGETGSGKSNILKCLIHQAIAKNYDVILIDFKRGVSFSDFADRLTIYYEYPEVVAVLKEMVSETQSRLDKFRNAKVDNITDYNRASSDRLERKIVFIDELAELLKTRDRETANALNGSIETLTRLSRAAGIHLIMGIQRPDSTIVSGQIKNNVPFRVCGRFVDPEPSRIMLGSDAASTLPNIKGRFIVKDDNMYEVQSYYFKDNMATVPQAQPVQHTATAINISVTAPQARGLGATIKATKATFANFFFEVRNRFNESDMSRDEFAVILIVGQINPLLLAHGKSIVRYKSLSELALGMVALLLDEAGTDPEQYDIPQAGLSTLLDSVYVNKARFALMEKLYSREFVDNPLIFTLSAASDLIAHAAELGGARPSMAERLYNIFKSGGQLPQPVYIIWAALAVATEFDDDLWEDYQVRLFDHKSKNPDNAVKSCITMATTNANEALRAMEQLVHEASQAHTKPHTPNNTETEIHIEIPPEIATEAMTEANVANNTLEEQPKETDSFDFDFSKFRK